MPRMSDARMRQLVRQGVNLAEQHARYVMHARIVERIVEIVRDDERVRDGGLPLHRGPDSIAKEALRCYAYDSTNDL